MNIYITRNGNQLGPYSIDDARRMRDAGQFHDQDLAWREGMPGWIPLAQMLGSVSTTGGPVMGRSTPTAARLATAAVIFVVGFPGLFLIIGFIAFVIGAAYSGMHAAIEQHAVGYDQGHQVGADAGRKFSEQYGPTVFGLSALVSFIAAALAAWGLSFSNLLPWCRAK